MLQSLVLAAHSQGLEIKLFKRVILGHLDTHIQIIIFSIIHFERAIMSRVILTGIYLRSGLLIVVAGQV